MDAIVDFFSALPRELYVFVISMLPIVELRGAIPVGATLGVPFYVNYPLAVIGNLLPVPFILLFITKFMDLLHRSKRFRPLVDWLRRKADKYSTKVLGDEATVASAEVTSDIESCNVQSDEQIDKTVVGADSAITEKPKRKMTLGVFFALLAFVAIPLPGTGAWTGALVASIFNLPKKHSMLAITLGVITSGIIMSLVSYGVLGFLSWLTK